MNDLATAKTTHENLTQQDIALSTKLVSAVNEQNSQRQELDSATSNCNAIEKLHIMDQASDAEVTAAQQLCNTLEAKLATTNRRVDLIKTARSELVPKIAAAAQNLKIARRDFCFRISNEKLARIKQNQDLKSLLLEAMAAAAANGQVIYTVGIRPFATQNLDRILPEITQQEVWEETEIFKKKHGLNQ